MSYIKTVLFECQQLTFPTKEIDGKTHYLIINFLQHISAQLDPSSVHFLAHQKLIGQIPLVLVCNIRD